MQLVRKLSPFRTRRQAGARAAAGFARPRWLQPGRSERDDGHARTLACQRLRGLELTNCASFTRSVSVDLTERRGDLGASRRDGPGGFSHRLVQPR